MAAGQLNFYSFYNLVDKKYMIHFKRPCVVALLWPIYLMRIYFYLQISAIVGIEIKPDKNSSLLNMLDAGLSDFADKYVSNFAIEIQY